MRPPPPDEARLADRVHASLREGILTLSLRPGEWLRKSEIAARFGASRGPVATALARLEAEGLVRVVPRTGSYVARLDMGAIAEAAFLRAAIETAAAARAAERLRGAQTDALRRNLAHQRAYAASGDAGAFYRADAEMHALILAATGHPGVGRACEALTQQLSRARRLMLPVPGRIEATLAEHAAIVAAIAAGRPDAARAAMEAHLTRVGELLAPLERAHPDLFESPSA